MEQHHIDIEIRPDGEVKIHIKGAKGKQCLEYAEFFQKIVGEIKEKTMTHEFYEPDSKVRIHLDEEQKVKEIEE